MRSFTTQDYHRTKRRAQQHAAYKAYIDLYHAGLINNNLLPLSSVIEPEKEEDVKAMLAEVAKREGTARVSTQMDPWRPREHSDAWFAHELAVEGLPTLLLLTRQPLPAFEPADFPALYVPGRRQLSMSISPLSTTPVSGDDLRRAQQWTYRLFIRIYGSRMDREKDDFSYLFLPASGHVDEWEERREWMQDRVERGEALYGETSFMANAEIFGKTFGYPSNLALVRGMSKYDKPLRLLRWRHGDDPLSAEEEFAFYEQHKAFPDVELTYPLMVVRTLPRRRNFLIPFSAESTDRRAAPPADEIAFCLHPRFVLLELASTEEVHQSLLLPSVLRWLEMALTVSDMRATLFASSSVTQVALPMLITATTAPVSQERSNYQRLETLGDTVLKFVASNQLYAQYPLWHEGYLSRKKDHAVANVSLAKAAVSKGLFRWIIRNQFVPKKWKPHYISNVISPQEEPVDEDQVVTSAVDKGKGRQGDNKKSNDKKKAEDLSTKMLADVVESLIGAAYEHGGFDMAIDCVSRFGLGLSWKRLPERIEAMHQVEDLSDLPDQLGIVEKMIGYQFARRTFLVQALTHGSYQGDSATMSLERLEFLGDSALDMIVVDYLYHAAGKNYSPGYMHIKKEAVVNSHILAYMCLSTTVAVEASMPSWSPEGGLISVDDTQHIHLWQCMLHSSHRVLEDQNLTFLRYQKRGADIAAALEHDTVYPWAALTGLQAPKFLSDMIESIIGAVYIDSHGSLDAVRDVLRTLGIMRILERVEHDDVDVLHPVSRLEIWAAKQKPERKELEFVVKKEKGQVSCAILVDGEELVKVETSYRSKISQDEVRFRAAEEANRKVNAQSLSVDDAIPPAGEQDEAAPEPGHEHEDGI